MSSLFAENIERPAIPAAPGARNDPDSCLNAFARDMPINCACRQSEESRFAPMTYGTFADFARAARGRQLAPPGKTYLSACNRYA
jgi:hypothetical protein